MVRSRLSPRCAELGRIPKFAMLLQLKSMFFPDDEATFSADKFINLSKVLESVGNASRDEA
jgi:hypothetical protein